ncbi:Kinase [Hexamita inflata]|uniref:CMGC CDK n=1 Tax=Hexamita inflata TaxID=28002 RepID=A0AA86REN7_9EUKA|nr:CMGC CDK [Hexamita inflata]
MFKYKNCSDITQGAFGSIIQATQCTPDDRPIRLVAIKKLIEKQQNERNPISQSPLEEIQILQQLSHPNIIKCLDSFQEGNYTYYVMPLCPFCLSDLIYSQQILPIRAVQSIMHQLMSGLAYLHSKQIMHRDMKPRNILINQFGVLQIIDFGQSYQTLNGAGTRNYRAPELLLNVSFSPKADVFACGCILFELITRRSLFCAVNDIELIVQQNQLLGPLENSPNLKNSVDFQKIVLENGFKQAEKLKVLLEQFIFDEEIEELLLKMLEVNEEKRYSAAECLEHQFVREGGNYGKVCLEELIQVQDQGDDAGWS